MNCKKANYINKEKHLGLYEFMQYGRFGGVAKMMKPGEIVSIGRHRLMCGDSTNADDVQQLLDGKRFDICITDPPYLTTALKMDKDGMDMNALALSLRENMKKNAWLFIFGPIKIIVYFYDVFRHKFEYQWFKSLAPPVFNNTKRPLLAHETCWAFIHKDLNVMGELYFERKELRSYGHKPWSSQFKMSKPTEYKKAQGVLWCPNTQNKTSREGTTVLMFPPAHLTPEHTAHPTQKPQEMYELILRGYCKPEGLAYEPCGGSGTGMAAAEVTGRTCYMMEQEPKYCEIIKNRMKNIQTKLESYTE